jgi:hypothetical protein
MGNIANIVVLAAWFTQRGSQPATGVTSSAEGWSVVSAFKLTASRVSPRLDPGPQSSRMMSFTPVYIQWDDETGPGEARGASTGSRAAPSAKLGHFWLGTGSDLARGKI